MKKRRPSLLSCCPEREPLTIDQWRERVNGTEQRADLRMRNLVDWTYLHATEGEAWPSSDTKDQLIARSAFEPTQADADAMKRALPNQSGPSNGEEA